MAGPIVAYSYIRVSTEQQLKGDGLKRQLERSRAYALEHGLELANEAQLEDRISAFKGANVTGGNLGIFLAAVEAGTIERGSYLLIESLDRLSRQEVWKSLSLFLQILKAGINIVTLVDGRVYTIDDDPDLFQSLTVMTRAHDESRTKSKRLTSAWAAKRKAARAHGKPLTRRCPAWLRLNAEKNAYEIIQQRSSVVRSIFRDADAGMGSYSITRRLNAAHTPTFQDQPEERRKWADGWQTSYITKILSNRAVIGEFQPHKLSAQGKRVPDGEPISYFPKIIEDDLFYRVQLGRSERRRSGRGRKGSYISNLFSGIAICAYCSSTMGYENKGSPPKGGSFLVCDAAKRGVGCDSTRWRYHDFEKSFLASINEVELGSVIGNDDDKKNELDNNIKALQGEHLEIQNQMDRAWDLHTKAGAAADFVANKLDELSQRKIELETQLKEKQRERTNLDASASAFYDSKDEIKALIEQLQNKDTRDLYQKRSRVAARIKSIISQIQIAAAGYKGDGMDKGDGERYYVIAYKDGSVQKIDPSNKDHYKVDRRHRTTL